MCHAAATSSRPPPTASNLSRDLHTRDVPCPRCIGVVDTTVCPYISAHAVLGSPTSFVPRAELAIARITEGTNPPTRPGWHCDCRPRRYPPLGRAILAPVRVLVQRHVHRPCHCFCQIGRAGRTRSSPMPKPYRHRPVRASGSAPRPARRWDRCHRWAQPPTSPPEAVVHRLHRRHADHPRINPSSMNVPLDGPSEGVTVTALGLDDAPPIEFRYTPHRRMDVGRSEPTLPILILPGAVHPSVATRHERIVKAGPNRRRLRRCRRIRWKFHGRRCGIHGQIG